jgi:hypothetical protein
MSFRTEDLSPFRCPLTETRLSVVLPAQTPGYENYNQFPNDTVQQHTMSPFTHFVRNILCCVAKYRRVFLNVLCLEI